MAGLPQWQEFDNQTPGWESDGVEPPQNRKTAGYQAGYKPPADWFNWFWTRVSKCIAEMQEKIKTLWQAIIDTTDRADAQSAIVSRVYQGVDLTVVFAEEIAGYSDVWAWIQARAQDGNFAGLNVGDYIPFVAGGNTIKAEIAGMDTYFEYGSPVVGHHIDFISRDCWPEPQQWNKAAYNNGLAAVMNPWMCSNMYAWLNSLSMSVPNAATANPATVAVNYSTTGVYDKLPTALKNVIVSKVSRLPRRFTAGTLLTDDNNSDWQNMGKLWLPSEVEVYGARMWGTWTNAYGVMGQVQYPIFANNMKRIKGGRDGGAGVSWWLSTPSGSSAYIASSYSDGTAGSLAANNAVLSSPVCFRIA